MLPAHLQRLVLENSPFALATQMIAGREQTVFRFGPATLLDIYRKAAGTPSRSILVNDQHTVTLESLFARAAAFAQLFASHGISECARVAILLDNDIDWVAAFIALTSTGAVAVLTGGSDPIRQAQVANCNVWVTDRTDWVGPGEVLHAPVDSRGFPPLAFPAVDPDRDACIVFTSGSSGNPKGVIHTHRGIVTGLMNMMLAGALVSQSQPRTDTRPQWGMPSTLLRAPLHHVSGYMQLLLTFMTGGRLVRSSQGDICNLIPKYQITSIVGATDVDIQILIETGSMEALKPLRAIAIVGRHLPAALRHTVRSALPDLGMGSGYGLTETNGLICAIGNNELDIRPGAMGRLLPTVECRIRQSEADNSKTDAWGDIELRGAMLMRGYCHQDGTADGWFSTGDIGYISQDGYLHVLDKRDRVLRHGSQYISCRAIEEATRLATGLSEIAALAGDDSDPARLTIVGTRELDNFSDLRDTLARNFPPEIIHAAKFITTDRLPLTPSGKIAYARLAREAVGST